MAVLYQSLYYLEIFPQYHPWSARARSVRGGRSGVQSNPGSCFSMVTEGWGGTGVETEWEVRGAGGKIMRQK